MPTDLQSYLGPKDGASYGMDTGSLMSLVMQQQRTADAARSAQAKEARTVARQQIQRTEDFQRDEDGELVKYTIARLNDAMKNGGQYGPLYKSVYDGFAKHPRVMSAFNNLDQAFDAWAPLNLSDDQVAEIQTQSAMKEANAERIKAEQKIKHKAVFDQAAINEAARTFGGEQTSDALANGMQIPQDGVITQDMLNDNTFIKVWDTRTGRPERVTRSAYNENPDDYMRGDQDLLTKQEKLVPLRDNAAISFMTRLSAISGVDPKTDMQRFVTRIKEQNFSKFGTNDEGVGRDAFGDFARYDLQIGTPQIIQEKYKKMALAIQVQAGGFPTKALMSQALVELAKPVPGTGDRINPLYLYVLYGIDHPEAQLGKKSKFLYDIVEQSAKATPYEEAVKAIKPQKAADVKVLREASNEMSQLFFR